jgi:polyisoprenoid-binding protein YceI
MKPSLLHITLLSGALLLGSALFFNYRFINPPANAPDANKTERTEKVSAKSPDEVKEEDKVRDKSVWQIDRGASQLQFTATQKSAATTGNFKLFKLNTLRFDAANPENANVSIEVDISSIELGNTLIEQTLLAKDWFDVKSHPSARFSATGFTHKGEDRYQLQGELTINGITTPQPVELVIMSDEEGESGKRITAEGTAIISRTKFGIGQGEWASTETLKDEVTLKIKVTATKPQ